MIETPEIARTEARQTAVIRMTIPKDAIQREMGPGIQELMSAVAAQGIGPAGPWYSHHFRIDPHEWDFEIGVPVTGPVTPAGRVRPGQLPAATVARTVYRGGYEGLGAAWGELDRWVGERGREAAPDLWECYVAGPESSGDPGEWRTELNRPLVG